MRGWCRAVQEKWEGAVLAVAWASSWEQGAGFWWRPEAAPDGEGLLPTAALWGEELGGDGMEEWAAGTPGQALTVLQPVAAATEQGWLGIPWVLLGCGHLSQPRETGLHLLPFFPAETPRDTGMVPLSQCEVVSAVGHHCMLSGSWVGGPLLCQVAPLYTAGPVPPHSSFPAQKVDKISPTERPETCPFTSLRLFISPCPIRPQYHRVVCWAHQRRWKLEHLSLQQGETGGHASMV